MKISADQRQSILDYWGDLVSFPVSEWKRCPEMSREEMVQRVRDEFRSAYSLELIQAQVIVDEAARLRGDAPQRSEEVGAAKGASLQLGYR